jgi:hypothetical protein
MDGSDAQLSQLRIRMGAGMGTGYYDSRQFKPPVARLSVGRAGALTRQLQHKEGALWRFLASRLDTDSIKAIRREAKPRFLTAKTILSGSSPPMATWEYGLVGTAFDYRLRYALAVTPANHLVAALGVRRLTIPAVVLDDFDVDDAGARRGTYRILDRPAPPPGLADVAQGFIDGLDASISALNPVRRRLDRTDEERLVRFCLILAALEQVFRSGMLGERSPLIYPSPCASPEELMARAQAAWVDDLCAMASAFYDVAEQHGLFDLPHVLNPTFEGSADIKADADLIISGCLLDVKCTVKPSLSLEALAQLLGYVLVDYPDAYGIDSVGFYLARQGLLLRWPLARLLGHEVSRPELAQLRDEFRYLLRSPAQAAR